ncbi:MAG: T9SS type A sorting domain-containing protein, partial [bacterium]
YSANYINNSVSVIDGITNSIITTAPAGSYPNAFVYNPTNNKIYCANGGSDNVTVIDGETDSIVTTIPVVRWPIALAHNSVDNKIYCANNWRDTVTVIDGETDSIITNILVGDEPYALIFNPINNKIYCANPGLYPSSSDSTITVIDGETDSVIITIVVGNGPKAFTYNPQYNRVYVANYYSNSVSVIRDSLIGIAELTQNAVPFILNLYPNPVKKSLTIHASIPLRGIKIYDILGNLVGTEIVTKPENTTTISLQHLSAGVYFLKVNTEDAEFIRKVVVTK